MTNEEAIIYLKQADVTIGREIKTKTAEALEIAINTLEQESTFQKKAEVIISQLRVERDRLRDAFDKVKAEIETKYGYCDICEYFEDYDYEENDISEYRPIGDIADILQIIDKYKAESEET